MMRSIQYLLVGVGVAINSKISLEISKSKMRIELAQMYDTGMNLRLLHETVRTFPLVMVRFGSVRFRGHFARTPNWIIGSVQHFPRTLN